MSFKITRDELEEEVFKTSEMEFSNIMKMLLKRRRIDNMVALSGSSHPELGNIVSKLTKIPIVISGGISSIDDITDIKKNKFSNIQGVIVGKAIYDGNIDIKKLRELI